ncbi:hypothetical protein NLI96_g8917 [Meripilus lineatus]|uniref:Uncharacterized protein n=1 Tax=Meripilus lineatus TaxID=2056292 RepID=A0AAD5UY25_9APHY|nr:hypothetical protein NLI96_g8917 [Physisporinus lineatus]
MLQTLYRLENEISTRNSIEGSVRAYEVVLKVQRELVLIDKALNMPDLLETLDSLAYCSKEAGRADDAVDYASEALQICREFAKKDAKTYTLQLTASFERMLVYLLHAGRSEEWMKSCREALNLWQRLVTGRDPEFERYAPRFEDSYNNILLSHPPYASYVYQHRAMVVWTKLVVRDVDQYGPSFARALCAIANSPFSRDARKEPTSNRDGAVDIPQEPNLVQALEDTIESLPTRKCDELTITHGSEIVEVCRVLAAQDIDTYGLCFVRALSAHANSFDRWCRCHAASNGYKDKSSIYRREAIGVLRKLAARDPDRYGPALVHALEQMINIPSKKRGEDALSHRRDTVDVCREIADVDVDRYGPCLAQALRALADHLFTLGRQSESFTYRCEAAHVLQKISNQAVVG